MMVFRSGSAPPADACPTRSGVMEGLPYHGPVGIPTADVPCQTTSEFLLLTATMQVGIPTGDVPCQTRR
jgi:hypothetical protein